MAFDKDTGASAGKKSKRGSSKQIHVHYSIYSSVVNFILLFFKNLISIS